MNFFLVVWLSTYFCVAKAQETLIKLLMSLTQWYYHEELSMGMQSNYEYWYSKDIIIAVLHIKVLHKDESL